MFYSARSAVMRVGLQIREPLGADAKPGKPEGLRLFEEVLKKELKNILNIQLSDVVKARWLDNELSNDYVKPKGKKVIRSQVETYQYLTKKTMKYSEIGSH